MIHIDVPSYRNTIRHIFSFPTVFVALISLAISYILHYFCNYFLLISLLCFCYILIEFIGLVILRKDNVVEQFCIEDDRLYLFQSIWKNQHGGTDIYNNYFVYSVKVSDILEINMSVKNLSPIQDKIYRLCLSTNSPIIITVIIKTNTYTRTVNIRFYNNSEKEIQEFISNLKCFLEQLPNYKACSA